MPARGWVKGQPVRFILGHRTKRMEPEADRFWKWVQKGDGCWLWTGRISPTGYGLFDWYRSVRSHPRLAHRMMYTLSVGPIPEGLCVLHRCDNPPCVNPAHLFIGTQQDNMADKVAKGRHRKACGGRMEKDA